MKRMMAFLSIVQILTYGNLSHAYDQGTHLLLTERAVLQSLLPNRLVDCGLSGVDDPIESYTPLGEKWDYAPGFVSDRETELQNRV
jgi:hypothetical protein